MSDGAASPNTPERRDWDVAMRRVVYLAAGGGGVVAVYGLAGPRALSVAALAASAATIAVGLISGGAALVLGGLLGFLFGIPYAQTTSAPAGADKPGAAGQNGDKPRYRPNSNLEQVSDWLTKIIVGVGLVEFDQLLTRLWDAAGHVSTSMSGDDGAQGFAAALLVYFAVCGFVFGFLWARLYLLKWFTDADDVKELRRTVDRLQEQQQADAQALALSIRQLNRTSNDPPVNDDEVKAAIKAASPAVRAQIYGGAVDVSNRKDVSDYQAKLDAAISIFDALIATDDRHIYYDNHAQRSYALRRRQPPDWAEAVKSITRAIEIRTKLGVTGWRYYEFNRARCLIEQDPAFLARQPSSNETKAAIVQDLEVAAREKGKWGKWIDSSPAVAEWMKINAVAFGEP